MSGCGAFIAAYIKGEPQLIEYDPVTFREGSQSLLHRVGPSTCRSISGLRCANALGKHKAICRASQVWRVSGAGSYDQACTPRCRHHRPRNPHRGLRTEAGGHSTGRSSSCCTCSPEYRQELTSACRAPDSRLLRQREMAAHRSRSERSPVSTIYFRYHTATMQARRFRAFRLLRIPGGSRRPSA